jgi:hypothetical protein
MISTPLRSLLNGVASVWFLLLLVTMAAAQTPQGALVGTVSDPNGGRIAGATVSAEAVGSSLRRVAATNSVGEYRMEGLPPNDYRVTVSATNFSPVTYAIKVTVNSSPTIPIVLKPGAVTAAVQVADNGSSLYSQPLETTSSVQKTLIAKKDLGNIPLAHRSFANIAYLAPMTQPVEPSDPTKARITAVAFGGSSGLNLDLSVDGGDNNDDYIGGFLQNYSPDAMQEFVVRTSQFDADTSRTNPYYQIDLRVSRDFHWGERATIKPFVEFFNLLNRTNPGNNFIPDLSALPVAPGELDNAMHFCLNSACTLTRPITLLI